jgi:glycerate dehydrogenase
MSANAPHPLPIVVLDGYTLNPGDNPWDPVARLGTLTIHDRTPADLIVARSLGAAIVLTNKAFVDRALLRRVKPGAS